MITTTSPIFSLINFRAVGVLINSFRPGDKDVKATDMLKMDPIVLSCAPVICTKFAMDVNKGLILRAISDDPAPLLNIKREKQRSL